MQTSERTGIAIVGMACRFPGGVTSPDEYWQLLLNGVDAVKAVPPNRWNADAYYSPDPAAPGRMVTRWGGFIDDIEGFDASFFGISPREARHLDPQQRWALELAWEALEDGGIVPERLRGTATGVFVGVSNWEYNTIQAKDWRSFDLHTLGGGLLCNVSNRVSYIFDLRGPSLSVDTACSSSLVAIHLACESIQRGETAMAIAGGVNTLLLPETTMAFSKARLLSPSGRCHAFDQRADGYVRGEGAGAIVLKPVEDALRDGDPVYAVMRGTASNQDGRTVSISVPSAAAQQSMLRGAYASAGVDPRDVLYVEAHGTGTEVGDPIEAASISSVLCEGRRASKPCLVGSVKTNIGHLEAASGIASVIKVALMLKNRRLVPSLHFRGSGPEIPLDDLNLRVVTAAADFPDLSGPAIAGVNSFGVGGTNAHIVLEESAASDTGTPTRSAVRERAEDGRALCVLPVSARCEDSLRAYLARFSDFLGEHSDVTLADICWSACTRKSHLSARRAIVGSSAKEMVESIAALLEQERVGRSTQSGDESEGEGGVVFVFGGQGPQWWGMGRDLLEGEPQFRAFVEACDRIFLPLAGWSIGDELRADEADSRLAETHAAQPALFAIQAGVAALLRYWGMSPAAVIGHSVGEVAAAYTAGIYSLEDALRIIHHRSRLQHRFRGGGGMVAAVMSEQDLTRDAAETAEDVEIAAINSPSLLTLSGDKPSLERVVESLSGQGIVCRALDVDYAFHTRQMEPLQEELTSALRDIEPRRGEIPFHSCVTGEVQDGQAMDAGYWYRNVRQTVRFADAVGSCLMMEPSAFVEIGPHPVLQRAIRDCVRAAERSLGSYGTLQRGRDSFACLLRTMANLYELGVDIQWQKVLAREGITRGSVRLPRYPWRHDRHWKESRRSVEERFPSVAHPLLGLRRRGPAPEWVVDISLQAIPYLRDHTVGGSVLLPAAAAAEMALAAAREYLSGEQCLVEDLELFEPVRLSENVAARVCVRIDKPTSVIEFYVEDAEGDGGGWVPWARAKFRAVSSDAGDSFPKADLPPGATRMTSEEIYGEYAERGFEFGPAFRNVEWVDCSEDRAVGQIAVCDRIALEVDDYLLHPALLDGCFQCLSGVERVRRLQDAHGMFVPSGVAQYRVFRPPVTRLKSAVRVRSVTPHRIVADIAVTGEDGTPVADIRGFVVSRISRAGTAPDLLYRYDWEERPGQVPRSSEEGANWIVFCDNAGAGRDIANDLEALGHTCVRVGAGETAGRERDGSYRVGGDVRESLNSALSEILEQGVVLEKALYAWDVAPGPKSDDEPVPTRASRTAGRLLAVLQSLATATDHDIGAIAVATRGAQAANGPVSDPALSPAWGLVRVAAGEFPDCRYLLVDLDPAEPAGEREDLLKELLSVGGVSEVALRCGKRFEPVLRRLDPSELPEAPQSDAPIAPYRLTSSMPGPLDGLRLRELTRRDPGPGEVEVEVSVTGLNFRDVLKAMGSYPRESGQDDLFGDECSGVVVAAGKDVSAISPGDRVVVVAPGCFASHVTVRSEYCVPLPRGLGPEEAAGIPIAFLTAWYALVELGRLARGEKVLVHAAAGGVGQAAVQVCRLLGAEIIATAGSAEKRAFLRGQGIGNVYDSRSLDFVDGVMSATKGAGVDVVLNSLAGEFIGAGLSVLAPYGRFLELGKRDIYSGGKLDLGAFKRNVAFFAVDLSQLLRDRPSRATSLLCRVLSEFEEGRLQPMPHRAFPISGAADAFRFMARAGHTGKIVVVHDGEPGHVVAEGPPVSSRATYLVVGGLGGFGLATCRWLAAHGARRLVVMTRSGPPYADEVENVITEMRGSGVDVVLEVGDVSSRHDVREIVQRAQQGGAPLRGVIHAAMVIDDMFIGQLDRNSLAVVLAPKVHGAWWLHEETAELDLDFFVLYSSLAALLGTAGQGNYAAANTFLDGLASARRGMGLPALAVNWGAISDVGYLARNKRVLEHLAHSGVRAMPAGKALTALALILGRDVAQAGVFDVDWAILGAHYGSRPGAERFAEVVDDGSTTAERSTTAASILHTPAGERRGVVLKYLGAQLAEVSGLDESAVGPELRLSDAGLDSLMGFELMMRVERDLGVSLQSSRILQERASVGRLAEILEEKLWSDE